MNLQRMRHLMNRLPAAQLRVDRARATATRSTQRWSAMPRGSGISSPVEQGVVQLEEAREALAALREELDQLRRELAPAIDALEDTLQRECMGLRYLHGLSARLIACRMHYSEGHVFRVLRAAEQHMKEQEGDNKP